MAGLFAPDRLGEEVRLIPFGGVTDAAGGRSSRPEAGQKSPAAPTAGQIADASAEMPSGYDDGVVRRWADAPGLGEAQLPAAKAHAAQLRVAYPRPRPARQAARGSTTARKWSVPPPALLQTAVPEGRQGEPAKLSSVPPFPARLTLLRRACWTLPLFRLRAVSRTKTRSRGMRRWSQWRRALRGRGRTGCPSRGPQPCSDAAQTPSLKQTPRTSGLGCPHRKENSYTNLLGHRRFEFRFAAQARTRHHPVSAEERVDRARAVQTFRRSFLPHSRGIRIARAFPLPTTANVL